jgi:outer membrane murein-binding lipoprotein Lpp
MTTETKTKPTAAEVDNLCEKFDAAKMEADQAGQQLSTVKGELLATVQNYGYTPTNAEKTTRLEGVMYVADATTASTVEINEAAVGELQSELSRLKKPKVFSLLFERKVKHSLKKDAAGTLKLEIGGLEEGTQKRLLGIFAGCFKVNSKTPALIVELVTALREKEAAAAEKAAKKAARGTKKAAKGGK